MNPTTAAGYFSTLSYNLIPDTPDITSRTCAAMMCSWANERDQEALKGIDVACGLAYWYTGVFHDRPTNRRVAVPRSPAGSQ